MISPEFLITTLQTLSTISCFICTFFCLRASHYLYESGRKISTVYQSFGYFAISWAILKNLMDIDQASSHMTIISFEVVRVIVPMVVAIIASERTKAAIREQEKLYNGKDRRRAVES